jgi:hypothetical protein
LSRSSTNTGQMTRFHPNCCCRLTTSASAGSVSRALAAPEVATSCSASSQWRSHASPPPSAASAAYVATLRRARSISMDQGSRRSRGRNGFRRWAVGKDRLLRSDGAPGSSEASAAPTTTAKREGDTWILNGQGWSIGNAKWYDISVIRARHVSDDLVKDIIVEKIEHKIALKVVQSGEITLKDVRVPETNLLQGGANFSRATARPAFDITSRHGHRRVAQMAPSRTRLPTCRAGCSSTSRSPLFAWSRTFLPHARQRDSLPMHDASHHDAPAL